MVELAPVAPGPGDGGSQISAATLSSALSALEIASSAALPRSPSPADSGINEAGTSQLLQVRAGQPKQDANDAKAEPCEEHIKAAVRPGKYAKAGAKPGLKARKEAARQSAARYASIIEYFDATPYADARDQAVKEAFINIFDFVDYQKGGGPRFMSFSGAEALSKYSIENNKVFPIDWARESPMLSLLLRKFSGAS
ncbi:hypothetical protein LTR35_009433 [Friedmanniomyces endolithicus]|uniref:Uncharacterized protein n=1 Tax=Friedmanniomyces endolithicus TaxID=329885 RepID=A0AAN6J498_9PEZI|nr:hypothetical protein LTR35_009433 [Friedmanniomyces endolithicus]KAK0290775.1 hypothetical protein LTS00_008551 [Friedmanniomyces endolithicus]KAK0314186.1 hypothetical protein LTR82_013111 [Friedmanniomyces endolithicus]KAK0997868.1 hypothetical protein LTR54_009665 [Friedmanniomyces endolithicus]